MKTSKMQILTKAILTVVPLILIGIIIKTYSLAESIDRIDNILGWLPLIFLLLFFFASITAIWSKWRKRNAPIITAIILCAAISLTLFFPSVTQHWWIYPAAETAKGDSFDQKPYKPFAANTKVVKLAEPTTLTLEGELPRLDGATALLPIYAAFVNAVYDEQTYKARQETCQCNNTQGAYRALINHKADIIFCAKPSNNQQVAAREAGVELHLTPIGREAFVFLVGKQNPIDSISIKQIKNIYSGKTAYWKTLGWKEGGKVIPLQRPDGSGSQTGLQSLMGNVPIMWPPPLPGHDLNTTDSLMREVSMEWKGAQPAIGFSYRYYALTMVPNENAKLLSVNETEPSISNIKNGTYPLVNDFYAITNGEPAGVTKILIDWILSPEGQWVIEQTGYIGL